MLRRMLSALVVATSILAGADVIGAAEIKPHMLGWEQIFALEYGPGQYRGKPAVEGVVTNISPYFLTGVRLLVDTLDVNGNILTQKVAWVPGDFPGGTHAFFSVPTTPAPAYRVRVFTYDRYEFGGNFRH